MTNQFNGTGKETQREQILRFVRERGICTTLDIREAFGIELARIGSVLTRLRFDGLVENEKIEGSTIHQWAPTFINGEKGDYPIQVTRHKWTGHARDAMIAAFYGEAR